MGRIEMFGGIVRINLMRTAAGDVAESSHLNGLIFVRPYHFQITPLVV
jgi:hypothetical protein